MGRALRVGPLGEVLAVRAEDLDAVVLAVADEDAPVRGDGDAVRQVELAGAAARHAPRPSELAARREPVHATVAVAVGDVQVPRRRDREVRRAVERASGPRDAPGALAVVAGRGRRVHGPERHEELPVRRELPHGVVAVVRAVEHLVRADGDAVGPVGKLASAPGAQELARAVVDDDRMIAAADQEDAILRVDGHARDVAVLVPRRQLLPAWDHLVAQRLRLHAARPPRRRAPRAPRPATVRGRSMEAARHRVKPPRTARA